MGKLEPTKKDDRADALLSGIRAAVVREDHEEVTRLDQTLRTLSDRPPQQD